MIEVEIREDSITEALNRLSHSLTDMTPVMQEIGEHLRNSTQERMDQQLSPDGSPFAPRAPATLAAYARAGGSYNARVLQKTRTMRNTIKYEAMEDEVHWGSNAIQSAVMHFGAAKGAFGTMANGASIPWGDIPARPFLGVSDDDRTALGIIIEKYLEQITGDGSAA